VKLARIRPPKTRTLLRGPVATPPLVTRIASKQTRIRPRKTHAFLSPPTVVAPAASQAQQTILVKLAVQARLLLPRTKFLLSRPTVLIIPRPGVTWGEDIAATSTESDDDGGTYTVTDDEAVNAT